MSLSTIYQQYQSFLAAPIKIKKETASTYQCSVMYTKQSDLQTKMQIDCFDSGILLSRFIGQGAGAFYSPGEHFSHNLAFFIMSNGSNHSILDNQTVVNIKAGQLWLVQGDIQSKGEQKRTVNGLVSGIHCDFSKDKLERWLDEGLISKDIIKPSRHIQLLNNNASALMPLVQKITTLPYSLSCTLEKIELESYTLALVAKLLRFSLLKPLSRLDNNKINDAIDIIRAECTQPLTIEALARKVGMNECYLKKYFKQQTGQTIADYIRQERLNLAFDMLSNQGKTIQETMYFTGYKHRGNFCAIFKQKFGYSPSEIINPHYSLPE
ncbi:helix-turn-helix domain-containing protein [Pelistega europaea]|uniref:Helix-turn-helix transcriptional regulator n=1 Tax=Pelistega europaea TaxID=106147 RepID=A0A7Y4P5Z7_9BURK|nr:AraC family transcriptional regulator [Pelistega europaea]NOL50293.1 helix-turn-helix transcriptional regulator [Pelistega europaea]